MGSGGTETSVNILFLMFYLEMILGIEKLTMKRMFLNVLDLAFTNANNLQNCNCIVNNRQL